MLGIIIGIIMVSVISIISEIRITRMENKMKQKIKKRDNLLLSMTENVNELVKDYDIVLESLISQVGEQRAIKLIEDRRKGKEFKDLNSFLKTHKKEK